MNSNLIYVDGTNYPFKSEYIIKIPSPCKFYTIGHHDVYNGYLMYDIDMYGASIEPIAERWITKDDIVYDSIFKEHAS